MGKGKVGLLRGTSRGLGRSQNESGAACFPFVLTAEERFANNIIIFAKDRRFGRSDLPFDTNLPALR